MLIIIVLIHTDLPEPVAPAISTCGIFAISEIIIWPPMSRPAANAIFDSVFLNSLDSISSLKYTAVDSLLGTSIPTADFPGIGASIRISAAARLSLISSTRFNILLTLTPGSRAISNLVTAGPQVASVTCASTPKLTSVCCSLSAVSLSVALESPPFLVGLLSKFKGGNL